MTKASKKPDPKKELPSCDCECANCDIGAHERCDSSQCHMPKWKDIQGKAGKPGR